MSRRPSWHEPQHPRIPAGSGRGGEFRRLTGGAADAAQVVERHPDGSTSSRRVGGSPSGGRVADVAAHARIAGNAGELTALAEGHLYGRGYTQPRVAADRDGNRWILKEAQGDNREQAALDLADLWGFPTPDHRRVIADLFGTGEDNVYSAQRLYDDVVGDLLGVGPFEFRQMSVANLCYLAQEHLFDWAVANHDAHGGNFVRLADGSIRGVDKAAAFEPAFLGYPLTWYHRPDGRHGPAMPDSGLVYAVIYHQISVGAIPRSTADKMRHAALDKAREMADLPERDLRDMAHEAWGERARDDFDFDYDTAVDTFVARVQALPETTAAMWDDLLASAIPAWRRRQKGGG